MKKNSWTEKFLNVVKASISQAITTIEKCFNLDNLRFKLSRSLLHIMLSDQPD